MIEQISLFSMVGMAVSLFIAVGMPVTATLVWWKRTNAKWSSVLIGAATFFGFAMILEQLFHVVVLGLTGNLIKGNIWVYAIYGGICAGVFEEVGRLLAMKFLMKKNLNKENAIMYGIGHGGIEAVLIVGLSMFSNLVTSIMINSGQFEVALNTLDAATRSATIEQLSALWTTEPYMFFMGGIERISAFSLHICLSYLVYKKKKNSKMVYFYLAIFLHFVVDAATVLLSKTVPIPVLEALLLISVLAVCVFVRKDYADGKLQ